LDGVKPATVGAQHAPKDASVRALWRILRPSDAQRFSKDTTSGGRTLKNSFNVG
jgi:hypothetical protein